MPRCLKKWGSAVLLAADGQNQTVLVTDRPRLVVCFALLLVLLRLGSPNPGLTPGPHICRGPVICIFKIMLSSVRMRKCQPTVPQAALAVMILSQGDIQEHHSPAPLEWKHSCSFRMRAFPGSRVIFASLLRWLSTSLVSVLKDYQLE